MRKDVLFLEEACESFHDFYEEAANSKGWDTQHSCKVEWNDLPAKNKETMQATVRAFLMRYDIPFCEGK